MSHEEKQNAVSLVSTLIVSVPFIIFVLNKFQTERPTGTEELKFWASAILLMIPLRIISYIVFYIIATIMQAIITQQDPEKTMITDERDKLIELKGAVIGFYTFCFGFLAAMIALLISPQVSTLFFVLIFAGLISEIASILAKIYFYRMGV